MRYHLNSVVQIRFSRPSGFAVALVAGALTLLVGTPPASAQEACDDTAPGYVDCADGTIGAAVASGNYNITFTGVCDEEEDGEVSVTGVPRFTMSGCGDTAVLDGFLFVDGTGFVDLSNFEVNGGLGFVFGTSGRVVNLTVNGEVVVARGSNLLFNSITIYGLLAAAHQSYMDVRGSSMIVGTVEGDQAVAFLHNSSGALLQGTVVSRVDTSESVVIVGNSSRAIVGDEVTISGTNGEHPIFAVRRHSSAELRGGTIECEVSSSAGVRSRRGQRRECGAIAVEDGSQLGVGSDFGGATFAVIGDIVAQMGSIITYAGGVPAGSNATHDGTLHCLDDQTRFSGYPGGNFRSDCLRWSRRGDRDDDDDDEDDDDD